jgi:nucleoid-associated protein YgaU
MTTGTKIFLAVFAAFVGVLVVYYGVLLPEAQTLPALSPAMSVTGQPPAARGMESTAPLGDVTAANTTSTLGSEPAGLSSGGFKFDLPVPATIEPVGIEPASSEVTPVQHAATDPLSSEPLPPPLAENPQPASSNEPAQPANQVVVSPPVANQPVTLPGATRQSRTTQPKSSVPQPPPTSDYVVKSGDTMSSIAADWFGDANKWSLIAKENPNIDPARLSVGQKLRLPPKDAKPATVSTVVKEQSPSTDTTYTVRSGDTLAKIAREYLGDVSKWKLIYDANRKTIGSDPAALKPGTKLKLPRKA